jgi:ADP-ribose pyrophosphatase YjhB (NUDIX family)
MARTDHYHDPNAPTANSIQVAVSAFVLNDAGQLLLIRRSDNGLYSIPGGGQEVGETITQTVVREVQEETGITVEVTGLIGIYSDPATSSPTTTAKSARSSPSASAPARSPASHRAAMRAPR